MTNISKLEPHECFFAAPLVLKAIDDIAYTLTGSVDIPVVLERLEMWISSSGNRLSYENIFVHKENGHIDGILISYPGYKSDLLDKPISEWLKNNGLPYQIDPEVSGDVLYIDSLAVTNPGKGTGTLLIRHAIKTAKETGFRKLSLNVETKNSRATSFYKKLDFIERKTIVISGSEYYYMEMDIQYTISGDTN